MSLIVDLHGTASTKLKCSVKRMSAILLTPGTVTVQITTIGFVYPSLLVAYFGEAAYLATFPADFAQSYFAAIPQPLFWPMFVIAVASALVGSQSLITSAFSVARQSAVMSCFPPVRVTLTS